MNVDLERAQSRLVHHSPGVVAFVRARDGEICRYCGQGVNFADHRSPQRGTYDFLEAAPPIRIAPSNVVVACGACKAAKGERSLSGVAMVLLQPRHRDVSLRDALTLSAAALAGPGAAQPSMSLDAWNESMVRAAAAASSGSRVDILQYAVAANELPAPMLSELVRLVESGDLAGALRLFATSGA